MTTLAQLTAFAETRWPISEAAEWDNPGLAAGDPSSRIARVLLSVDLTPEITQEAILGRFDLIFTHHPFIFKGLQTLSLATNKGKIASECIRAGVAVYSAHTNADFVTGGVSETLALSLGLTDLTPLTPAGEGVVGTVQAITLLEFARRAGRALPSCAQGVLVQGDPDRLLKRVGLVAGAGDSYLEHASGLDLFITSDLRHHPASDFRDSTQLSDGPALMNIPHFSAEWPWLNQAAAELKEQFPSVEFVVSEINTDPWTFAVMQ
jgi:dinuclear metal center YbgI/SA1388 family protein